MVLIVYCLRLCTTPYRLTDYAGLQTRQIRIVNEKRLFMSASFSWFYMKCAFISMHSVQRFTILFFCALLLSFLNQHLFSNLLWTLIKLYFIQTYTHMYHCTVRRRRQQQRQQQRKIRQQSISLLDARFFLYLLVDHNICIVVLLFSRWINFAFVLKAIAPRLCLSSTWKRQRMW